MANPSELARLINELRGVASPTGRMKVLARAWRGIRSLDSKERSELASRVGFEGAGELIERLAARKLSPAILSRALEMVRGADPSDLKRVVVGLRDPQQRQALLRRGLNGISAQLIQQEEEPPKTPAIPLSEPPRGTPAEEAARRALATPAVSAKIPPAKPRAAPVPAKPPPKRDEEPPQWKAPKPAPPTPTPEVRPEPRAQRPAGPTQSQRSATRAAAAGGTATAVLATATARRPPVPKPEVDDRLLERIGSAHGLTARFRVFRRDLEDAREMGLTDLGRLLELFPAGWARRRVLNGLLASRIPGDLHQAIFLIEQLQSEMARRWCVATILKHWELSDNERNALVERHGFFPG